EVCPADAIKRTADGVVQSARKPRCIACGNCVMACPFGVPEVYEDRQIMMKCDMCYDRTSVGKKPPPEIVRDGLPEPLSDFGLRLAYSSTGTTCFLQRQTKRVPPPGSCTVTMLHTGNSGGQSPSHHSRIVPPVPTQHAVGSRSPPLRLPPTRIPSRRERVQVPPVPLFATGHCWHLRVECLRSSGPGPRRVRTR